MSYNKNRYEMKKIYVRPDSDQIALRYENNILSGNDDGYLGESVTWDDDENLGL